MPHAPKLFVLTGGPGSGKSTLVETAARAGISVTEEVGRAIIRQEMANGGSALPWCDRQRFAERMLEEEIRTYQAAATGRATLCDRGVPDVLGYARLEDLQPLAPFEEAAERFRYATRVFIAPPWRAIYGTDGERKQDWDLAVRTHDMMVSVYGRLGYQLLELPKADVATRLTFIRAMMNV